jgi:formate hydrogenlyase subunit 6/NADH:ubiquinone oxidoreductase subunit I
MTEWFRNVYTAVATVVQGMLVTLRVFGSTYDQKRRTFTEHFEYPELPAPVAARYRGFHRYDLTTCIACDQCAKACPVDCIYDGTRMLYIQPDECVDCGACEPVCPVEAIYYEDDVPGQWQGYKKINTEFFIELGSPGGASKVGETNTDHADVTALAPKTS